jgi:flagella basal body P-ring formation protein FlgA
MGNYPTMTITSIYITPHGYTESLPANAHVVFDKEGYKQNRGTFYIPDSNGIRHYFDYSLDATLEVLHVTQKTSRKAILSTTNSTLESIPFVSFRGKPLTKLPETPYRFRSSLKEGTVITDQHIEPNPIVLRGAKISAQIKSGTVIVEFIATATQEGALYDIITIEKADGKRVRAKIIGENTVELQ